MNTNYRILVVDDEEDLCDILKFNLENEGYEVETANSAEEALKMDLTKFHLLLLDVMMGEISGFKMAKMLKQVRETRDIPIIFLTARDTENDAVTGFTSTVRSSTSASLFHILRSISARENTRPSFSNSKRKISNSVLVNCNASPHSTASFLLRSNFNSLKPI